MNDWDVAFIILPMMAMVFIVAPAIILSKYAAKRHVSERSKLSSAFVTGWLWARSVDARLGCSRR